ncbi:alpha/beta fold hydrolase [Levilactobacillus zymae]|uniref:Epoxide hydrolase n=1 Tax=Levilactobacillus zymae TaxID=267363 RepID=A0A1Y6JWD9_9LACO|nr:alpha/beta fold hydrolase [Levilactobacillus zymae]SMS14256.1 Epoxide hydrolase [Levilactobacillus zymae]
MSLVTPLGQRLTYTHDGLTLPVYRHGPVTGEAVLLLHGFPETVASWNAVFRRLTAAGYQTWVPVMRGYAATATPAGRQAYTTAHLVGDLTALIAYFHLTRVHVVGHDWGGFLAWKLAQLFPAKLRSLTILATPHPLALVWAYRHSTQLLNSAYIGAFQVPRVGDWLAYRLLPHQLRSSGLSAPATAALLAAFPSAASLRGPVNWYRGMLVPHQPPVPDPLIHVPTTYVWGRHDRSVLRRGGGPENRRFRDGRLPVRGPEQRPLVAGGTPGGDQCGHFTTPATSLKSKRVPLTAKH